MVSCWTHRLLLVHLCGGAARRVRALSLRSAPARPAGTLQNKHGGSRRVLRVQLYVVKWQAAPPCSPPIPQMLIDDPPPLHSPIAG